MLGLAVLSPLWGGCATGGGGSSASDDGGTGDDAVTGDAVAADGAGGEGGSGTSIDKACDDNAASYCAQLQQCAPFLLTTQYGDTVTCIARNKLGCMDALQAPGTGWTGDNLEACIKARSALACSDFLHGKPAPNACRVTGAIATSNACRYGAQCGTGYCRYASGASCGNCVTLGATGASCTSSSDCDGNLICAGSPGACTPPSGLNGTCSSTVPCQQGLECSGGYCIQPGDVGASCTTAVDCDYEKGVYCDTSASSPSCKSYIIAMNGQPCGAPPPGASVCFGGATCETMGTTSACVAPVQDGSPCNPTQGANCMPPSSCQMGICQLYSASMCK